MLTKKTLLHNAKCITYRAKLNKKCDYNAFKFKGQWFFDKREILGRKEKVHYTQFTL